MMVAWTRVPLLKGKGVKVCGLDLGGETNTKTLRKIPRFLVYATKKNVIVTIKDGKDCEKSRFRKCISNSVLYKLI